MKSLLILISICFSATAFAQSALLGNRIRPKCAAQSWWQAAETGKAGGTNGLQARRNSEGHKALGRRLCGRVRTSGYHAGGRARRASAGSKPPS